MQGLNTEFVAYKTSSPTTINCCIHIIYKLEELLQFIINTHTISSEGMPTTLVRAPLAVRDEIETNGRIVHLESFPSAYTKSITIIFIIIIYSSYLNLFRHRKSFRRKQSCIEHYNDQNVIATGVCC